MYLMGLPQGQLPGFDNVCGYGDLSVTGRGGVGGTGNLGEGYIGTRY